MNLKYLFTSGKNSKMKYFIKEYIHYFLPSSLFRMQLMRCLKSINNREDKQYILDRVNYYNKLNAYSKLPDDAKLIKNHTLKNRKKQKVYFFDTHHYLCYFSSKYRFLQEPGDVTFVPDYPSLVKSRPIFGNNENSVLLNQDKVRHFIFLKDKTPFREKKNIIIFRGKVADKPLRQKFLEMYFNHPMCDVGDVKTKQESLKKYEKPLLTTWQHLNYKFIMALEGNDVASNLKWVMSSNSIAVMPRPTYETWFMEGKLIPNYHYIEIKPDFSDLIERCNYYIEHPQEAEAIIEHAHEYVSQFFNPKREKLISLLVLEKYFSETNQMERISSLK